MYKGMRLGLIALTTTIAGVAGGAEPVSLTPTGEVQAQDLDNLAATLGVMMQRYDYDTEEPRCLHFYVDEVTVDGDEQRHDGAGLCGLAGPQRLTIQWVTEGSEISFKFLRYRRDVRQGGSVSGPTLTAPTHLGSAAYGIAPPEFRLNEETVLYHGVYGPNNGPQMSFRVIAELRENARGRIGTE